MTFCMSPASSQMEEVFSRLVSQQTGTRQGSVASHPSHVRVSCERWFHQHFLAQKEGRLALTFIIVSVQKADSLRLSRDNCCVS